MIHGRRVSHRDCVTCQWVATRQGLTTSSEEDILYLCICLYFELKTQTRDNRHPSLTHVRPLCWSWRETCTAAHTSTAWNNKRNAWICIANHLCLLPVRRLTHSWGSSGLHTLYFYRLHLKSCSQATWILEITRPGSTGCLKHIKLIMSFSLISVPSISFV